MPSSDAAPALINKCRQVFRLIVQDANTGSQHTNPAQVLPALFEGSMKNKEIGFILYMKVIAGTI